MKKRYITLLEIMIVIFLITLIGGVLGYNMKGSLEKGKAFKTKQAKRQLKDILLLEYAKGEKSLQEIAQNPKEALQNSQIVKKPKDLLQDGWGKEFKIKALKEKDTFKITSEKYKKYRENQK